jgi:hypothetical protein
MARKGFEETFHAIFQEMMDGKETLGVALRDDIDFEDPTLFAEELEEALFQSNNNYGLPNDTVFIN